MKPKKIYGPWIKWHGGECPVPPDTLVEVRLRIGERGKPVAAGAYDWPHSDEDGDIVEYRIVPEQPDLDAAENLLRANGYTIIPPVKPLTFDDVAPMKEAPEIGTWYWLVQPFNSRGVESFAWCGDGYDLDALRHRMAYRDREHALIAARHIFGLKGGEL
ncbi:hypothetical protein FVQ98_10500 [Ottowia sp. GY511]|uniref:Uncharacterized protein n=1 Tax=Ottowia flava TaxID=2675430 RepID=A0ABW4KR55_9BURK|nr:hypothetical protein [Ottowia sp. GY511]TXK27743.1 hypothetical protein FVQ98_10500 [Ottowia sp. GY511]